MLMDARIETLNLKADTLACTMARMWIDKCSMKPEIDWNSSETYFRLIWPALKDMDDICAGILRLIQYTPFLQEQTTACMRLWETVDDILHLMRSVFTETQVFNRKEYRDILDQFKIMLAGASDECTSEDD